MILKWTRQAILVIITAVMLLFAPFYYGNLYLLDPIKEEASAVTYTVDSKQSLLDSYPPSEELLEEYKEKATATEKYLPIGDQANVARITLEQLASQTNVNTQRVSRNTFQETVEEIPNQFVKNNYLVEITSDSPENIWNLMERLISEERVWNISSLSYSKSGEENYTGNFNFDIYYFTNNNTSD